MGLYYSELASESDTGTITYPDYYNDLADICGTFRFDITDYWTLKLEYHAFTGAKGLSAWDNPSASNDFIASDAFKKDWTMLAVKMTVAF